MSLLQNAIVSAKADISIRESFDDPEASVMNEPTYAAFDMQCNEHTAILDFGNEFDENINSQHFQLIPDCGRQWIAA